MALNKVCIFLVLIALLSSMAHAATSCPIVPPQISTTITMPGSVYSEAIAVSMIALTLSIDVVAIGYILSRIFSGAGLKGWMEREYYEIAKTMILIASIFSILLFMSSMAVIISGQSSSNSYASNLAGLVNSGEIYLSGVNNSIACAYDSVAKLSIGIGALTSLTIEYYDPTPPVPYPDGIPLPYLITGVAFSPAGPTNEMLTPYSITVRNYESILSDTIVIVLFPISLMIGSEIALLPYIVKIGLLLVIPMGLILRSFPFVRGVGGVLIAIGIGLAIIYPSLLVLLNAPVTNVIDSAFQNTPPAPNPVCSSGIICTVLNGVKNILSGIASSISDTFISYGFNALYSIYPTLNDLVYNTVPLVVQFVLFIMDLAIAIPIMDTIARMLGSSTGVVTSIGKKLRLV